MLASAMDAASPAKRGRVGEGARKTLLTLYKES